MIKELKNDGQYKVELQTNDNSFEVSEKVEGTETFDRLKVFKNYDDAERYIENRQKRKEAGITKKKESLSAIIKKDYKYQEVKLTSLSPSRWGGSFDVWVTFADKKRSKESFYTDSFLRLTEGNKKRITEMQELRKEAQQIEDSLEKFNEGEIKSYFEDDE